MATENPRVWFKSISLENVRSFGTKQTINFTGKDGKAARWNVILGDNGTGKTTVLKGLVIGFYAPIVYGELDNNFFKKQTLNRSPSLAPSIDLSLSYDEFNVSVRFDPNSQNQPDVSQAVGNKSILEWLKFLQDDVLGIFAYGASRRIGDNGINKTDSTTFVNLFQDSQSLVNAEDWLVQAEYLSLKESRFRNRYHIILNILRDIFREEVSDIYINTETGVPKVFFKTHYGDVRLHELSLGYKTLIAWMVDLAKGLLDRYPDSENPLAETAVCLVDEIDLHLHPKFQRTIIQFLTDTFPNTQFIVTAHSPLIVLAAEERPLDANIILLKREDDHTVVVNDPVDVSKWSVDQILNSDLFGYVPPASESLTELRTERDALLAKPKLAKKEKDRLAELDEKIGFIPFGTNQNEIKAETIIQQLANALRSKQEAQ